MFVLLFLGKTQNTPAHHLPLGTMQEALGLIRGFDLHDMAFVPVTLSHAVHAGTMFLLR